MKHNNFLALSITLCLISNCQKSDSPTDESPSTPSETGAASPSATPAEQPPANTGLPTDPTTPPTDTGTPVAGEPIPPMTDPASPTPPAPTPPIIVPTTTVTAVSIKSRAIVAISGHDAARPNILILRNDDADITATPKTGTGYAVGDMLDDKSKVVATLDGTTSYFTDTDVTEKSTYRYAVYSYSSQNDYQFLGKKQLTVQQPGAAWMGGDKDSHGNMDYGTLQQESATNQPNIRAQSTSFTDKTGKMWLFGGYIYNQSQFKPDGVTTYPTSSNDLWQLSNAGLWTWWGGGNDGLSSAETAGTQGQTAPTNVPQGRSGHIGWTDKNGNFWIFGGYGGGPLNDLWKFDGKNWTWVKGPSLKQRTLATNEGVLGTKGVSAPTNYPPSRINGMGWTDTNGDLWLFGGEHYICKAPLICNYVVNGVQQHYSLNDLWKYNIAANEWTWMGGATDQALASKLGMQGKFGDESTVYPGSRKLSTTWSDAYGRLWMFGGLAIANNYPADTDPDYTGQTTVLSALASSKQEGISLNDLWVFDTQLKQWAYVKGNTNFIKKPFPQLYEVVQGKCDSTPTNSALPGARHEAKARTDSNGVTWIFGGDGASCKMTDRSYLDDVWAFFAHKDITKSYFTWAGGGQGSSNTGGEPGVSGNAGEFSSQYWPRGKGHRFGFWTDNQSQLWIYGGSGCGNDQKTTVYGVDLWKVVP